MYVSFLILTMFCTTCKIIATVAIYFNILKICIIYVTEFGKTSHVCTRIEIYFIVYYNHTQALSRYSDTIAIDKKVCFYRWLFADPIKPYRTIRDPVAHWAALIGWYVVPNCSTRRLLSLWYGWGCCGHLSGPLCTQLGRLCLLASLTHHPSHPPPTHLLICSTHDIAGCVQNISKSASPSSNYVS